MTENHITEFLIHEELGWNMTYLKVFLLLHQLFIVIKKQIFVHMNISFILEHPNIITPLY